LHPLGGGGGRGGGRGAVVHPRIRLNSAHCALLASTNKSNRSKEAEEEEEETGKFNKTKSLLSSFVCFSLTREPE
jgi:hypothetical protein